jgi:pilus assembly protein CpaB
MALRTEDPQTQLPKEGRKKRTALRGVVFIALALVAAAGVALLLTRYMESRLAAARVPTTKIVVAKVDIPVADPIKPEWLETIDWPAAARPEGAVANPALLTGQVATVPIKRGEAVLPSKLLVAGARSGLATIVPDGMRAVAVKVDDVIGVAGFIHPGDSVDVIVTMKPRDEAPFVAKIVLQNIKVLAVGKDIELKGKDAKEAKQVTVATLMVTSEESERLALSTDKGHILLALRGLGDEEYAETRGITPPVLLQTSAPEPTAPAKIATGARARPRRDPPRQEIPAAAARDRQVVEILRGDLYEKRAFDAQEKRP